VSAMRPGRPESAREKLVAAFTSTSLSMSSGAAAAKRRPRQPPNDSATNVTCSTAAISQYLWSILNACKPQDPVAWHSALSGIPAPVDLHQSGSQASRRNCWTIL